MSADIGTNLRDDVKAAYLYNFLRFCQWPPATVGKGDLTIGVLGDELFASNLSRRLKDRQVDGRRVKVVSLRSSLQAPDCDAIYIRRPDKRSVDAAIQAVAGLPILTIGETPSFSASGGMINFVEQNDIVRFAVNVGAAQKSGLSLSSQMLQFAIILDEHSRKASAHGMA